MTGGALSILIDKAQLIVVTQDHSAGLGLTNSLTLHAFRCGAPFNNSGLCSESLDAAIDRAQRLQATDPAAANSAWIEIEHRLVEDAIWVPLTNPVSTYSFSARTENIQVHPAWGILLSRLWLR